MARRVGSVPSWSICRACWWSRAPRSPALHLWQQKDAQLVAAREALAEGVAQGPAVQVATIAQGPKERLITLLGDTRPYQTATLYGKVSGYVKSIPVDRGDHVKAGQVVAEVESAETDRQYDAAVSDLGNKRKNAERARDLVARGWTSVQAADQADTAYRMAQANVAQLAVMKSYEILRAPFDGTVTARFVDVGALVQSSVTNQTSNQPVVTIADMSRLRVDVYVEQKDVPFVHVGDMADVADGANPDRKCRRASRAPPISSIRAPARCSSNWRSTTARTSWCRAASPT